jgi:hypothetical protein
MAQAKFPNGNVMKSLSIINILVYVSEGAGGQGFL